ncbi:TonB-dependent receptor [Paraglaciecola aquimarina]|uniref:TonB-dependent receptor n=1 Tax=Paraglaciecola algarum TaxID=3050085 RepID=A0ABS9D223_9ALTE|nr:TonB-dependent receptor [Paraglaciecola sp. G1-23]MCF2946955.1 TonB-dependent receptor [Paraglaciecola sp. G1-23]
MKHTLIKKSSLAMAIAVGLNGMSGAAIAQSATEQAESTEVIEVTGIRTALASALAEKRAAANIKEVIKAEDIGKLPDNNLAEVLENITGVQIDRTNGVGTGVQIRGTSANRVEINGVSSVSSGAGRTGISFEDLPAALISSLEVTKASTAKTVEGSVGGTINLRTLRGNSLKERLTQFRVQAENSDLADSTTAKFSGTFGDNWETDLGKVGVVVTASLAEQDVASANPRFDRDRVNEPGSSPSSESFPFLRTQFLDQPLNARNYETKNMTASIELQKTDDLKFYFDATINDQESADTNSRAFFSGVGGNPVIDNTTGHTFETINLGTVDGKYGMLDLGEVQVVTSGILGVGSEVVGGRDRIDPNLRTGNSNSARQTTSRVFAFGSEYSADKYQLTLEASYSDSESDNPSLNSSLDFINPNGVQPGPGTFNDNGTPAIFNIANDTFEFGIAQGLPETPTTAQLLNPSNYALRSIGEGLRTREGTEAALRADITYDVSDLNSFFTDVDAGIRWNKTTNTTDNMSSSNSFGNWNRPRADLFSEIVVPGASNFGDVDSRTLFVSDYLIIDNDVSFNNPQLVLNTINDAIATNNALQGSEVNSLLATPTTSISSFFDIEEVTTAMYVQGNYEAELGDVFVTGNVGVRYVTTDLESLGNSEVNGVVTPSSESSDYDFVLPRINVNAELSDDMILRLGIGKDIRRPNFDSLSTSATFGASASGTVNVGNPALEPEEIWSYDLSLEYYFSPSSFVSAGIFHKERTNLITSIQDEPAEPIGATGQIERDVTAPCEDGGIFNPNVPPENYNVFSSRTDTQGICVAKRSQINANGTETQSGIEFAAQYDLSEYEDELGWASGFGIIANYTYQESGAALDEFRNASGAINQILGRTDTDNSTPSLADDVVTERITLDKLSENAYNITMFYDKHDFSVRMRYTWRDAFTETLGRMRFNIPPVVGARGQLNMSVNYDVNEMVSVGIDGVNLTRDDRTRWCFNEGTLLCEQSLTDRRVTLGVTVKL